jgi:hypothetical protein
MAYPGNGFAPGQSMPFYPYGGIPGPAANAMPYGTPAQGPPPPYGQPPAGPWQGVTTPYGPQASHPTPYGYSQPAPPVQQQQPPAHDQSSAPQGWQLLFNPGTWTPTPCFVALMQAFFTYLDPRQTGYLTPEAYSAFLEAEGYPAHLNTCKRLS